MSINKTSGIFLCIDTYGVDIEVGANKNCDLFFRPYCENVGKFFNVWVSNCHSEWKAQTASEELLDIEDLRDRKSCNPLTNAQQRFLVEQDVDFEFKYCYIEWWS